MSHSNRTSLPEGYLWGWPNTGERRPVSSADPRMEVQPPGDGSYMPNVTTTPPPPGVWMAGAPQSHSNALQNPYAAGGAGNPLAGNIQTVALQGQPGSWQWHIKPLGDDYRIFGSPPETDQFQLMGRYSNQEQALKRMQMLKLLLGGE
jgi:hypothetical protein